MKKQFIDKKFQAKSLVLIEQVNDLLTKYAAQGYRLSLRQLYYQLVAGDLIPNNRRSYKRLGGIVGDARLAGLIDWYYIEDRERPVIYPSHWASPKSILESAHASFRLDRWKDQPCHVEIMVEKKALEGVLIPVCRELDVRFTANRGYSSLTAMYDAGERLEYAAEVERKEPWILYLGDHDPSGMDMDRDIHDRADLLSGYSGVALTRLALLRKQIEELDLPVNPDNRPKPGDSRTAGYVAEFGMSAWELDALEPSHLASLVRDAVIELRDDDLWDKVIERENTMKADLKAFADQYEETE